MKKSQVTLFIILGIVLIIMFVLIFSAREKVEHTKTTKAAKKEIMASGELTPIKNYLEDVLKDVSEDALYSRIGIYGGYLSAVENPEYEEEGTLNRMEWQGDYYPILFDYNEGNQQYYNLSLEEIEERIAKYVSVEFEKKINLSIFANTYNITKGVLNYNDINVSINLEDVDIEIRNYSIVLEKKDSEGKLDTFNVNIPVRLGLIYSNITKDILTNLSSYDFYTDNDNDHYNFSDCDGIIPNFFFSNPDISPNIKFIEVGEHQRGIIMIEESELQRYAKNFTFQFAVHNVNVTESCRCKGIQICAGYCEKDGDCKEVNCEEWYGWDGVKGAKAEEIQYCYNKEDITENLCVDNECKSVLDCADQDNKETEIYSCGECKYIADGDCSATNKGSEDCTPYEYGEECGVDKVCDGEGNCVDLSMSRISFWMVNEEIMSVFEDSWGDNDANHNGNLVFKNGKCGRSLKFNTENDFLEVDEINIPSGDADEQISIEFWLYPKDISITQGIIGIYNEWLVSLESNGEIWIRTWGNNNGGTTTTIPINSWSHVAVTWDVGSKFEVYVNGNLKESRITTTSDTSSNTGNNLRIGQVQSGSGIWNNPFFGRIDQVKIYNKALTQGMIQASMNDICQGEDDECCGEIDCSGWYEITGQYGATDTQYCYNKKNITNERCKGVGDCKDDNSISCSTQNNNELQYSCGVCKYIDNAVSCTGTTLGSCELFGSGVDCGGGKICDGNGNCVTPLCSGGPDSYDAACGTIDCSGWYVKSGTKGWLDTEYCHNKQDITTNNCKYYGQCKVPNSADCDAQPNDQEQIKCRLCKYMKSGTCTGTVAGSCTNYANNYGSPSCFRCKDGERVKCRWEDYDSYCLAPGSNDDKDCSVGNEGVIVNYKGSNPCTWKGNECLGTGSTLNTRSRCVCD